MKAYKQAGVKPGDKVRVHCNILGYEFKGTVLSLKEAEENWGEDNFWKDESDEFVYVRMDEPLKKADYRDEVDGYLPTSIFKLETPFSEDRELIEELRKEIEDILVSRRDSRISTLNNNGLVIKEKNGDDSHLIRMSITECIEIILKKLNK